MGIFSFITDLFKPASKLIDDLHTSTEEKMKLKNELANIQAKANEQFLNLAKAELEARTAMVQAEAQSTHWLQANWRPICSILLIALVVLDSFGIVTASQDLYTLATAFLGLYGAGRSVEKAAKVVKLGSSK